MAVSILPGMGSVAPAWATVTTIKTAVAGPITVNAGDEVDIVAGGSVSDLTDNSAAVIVLPGGTLNVSGGSVTAVRGFGVYVQGSVAISAGSVNGADGIAIAGGSVVISGGSVIGSGEPGGPGSGVIVYGGSLAISGGSVSGNEGVQVAEGGAMTMSGGSLSGNEAMNSSGADVAISGGSVTGDLAVLNGSILAGTLTMSGCNLSISAGQLTGTLLDGTAINVPIRADSNGQIILDNRCPADTVAPVTAGAPSPTPNANGWNNTDVTVNLTATDNAGGSGVQGIHYSLSGAQTGGAVVSGGSAAVTINTEGITTLTYFARDNAGNDETAQSLTIRIDKTTPTLTFGSPTPAPNAAGWNNTDVSIPFTAGDSVSGLDPASPSSPLVLTAEGSSVAGTVTITDRAGNSATFTSPSVKIDRTPPTIAYAGNAGTYAFGDTVNITGTATDSLSGVASSTVQNITGPASAFGPGPHTFSATATDNAGNVGSGSVTFTVLPPSDTVPPMTTATASPGPNAAGWNNGTVTVNLMGSDNAGGSGVQEIHYTLSGAQTGGAVVPGSSAAVAITAEGITTLSYFARDNAGNVEAAKSLTVRIDKAAPTVAYTGNAGTYTVSQSVNITFSASDSLAGIASLTGQNITGLANNFGLGTHAFSGSATDKAGNTGTAKTSFTVIIGNEPMVTLGMFVFAIDGVPTGTRQGNATIRVGQSVTLELRVRVKSGLLVDVTTQPTTTLTANGGRLTSQNVWRSSAADKGKTITITGRYVNPATGEALTDTVSVKVR